MTSKEAFNKLQHYINGTKLSGEEYLECCKILDKDLGRLEELEQENKELKEWCLILKKHLYIAPEMCELRMATPKNADCLIKTGSWTKYYNGIDVHEIDYKKFVDLYYSKIKEVLEE